LDSSQTILQDTFMQFLRDLKVKIYISKKNGKTYLQQFLRIYYESFHKHLLHLK